MVTAVRTWLCDLNVHARQPDFASSDYPVPLPLPKNSLPFTTVGWLKTVAASANPKAHLTLSFGTSLAPIPASFAVCIRLLIRSVLHPFQPFKLARAGAGPGHAFNFRGWMVDSVGGERKSAMACRSAMLSLAPCTFIDPDSRAATIARLGKRLRASGSGVRLSAPALWQSAQLFSKSAEPSGGAPGSHAADKNKARKKNPIERAMWP